MRFRNLLAAVSVSTAICLMPLCAFAYAEPSTNPAVFVRGLVMLQLEQQDGLHIVLPDAPGHIATITLVMTDGKRQVVPFKGHSALRAASDPEGSRAAVNVPELIRMRELYGNGIRPLVDRAGNQMSIAWSNIRAVRTEKVTDSRFTFVRKDNGQEIESFRPRNVAETIRIELNSLESLDFGSRKTDIDLAKVKEIWVEQVPKDMSGAGVFEEHFHHYLHYIERPADRNFDVEPKKVSGAVVRMPRIGNSFWLGVDILCDPVAID